MRVWHIIKESPQLFGRAIKILLPFSIHVSVKPDFLLLLDPKHYHNRVSAEVGYEHPVAFNYISKNVTLLS